MTLSISLQVIFLKSKNSKGFISLEGHQSFNVCLNWWYDEEKCFETYTGDIPAPAH